MNSDKCSICEVIGQLKKHYGVLSCRACAAFFRRAVYEEKIYKCRRNRECSTSQEQRVVCKACRLQKCRDLGMNLSILKNHKSQYYPKKDKSSKSLTSKNTPGHKMSSPINNATSSNETSILPKILKAYQTLQARQDVLYSSMKKANLFEHPEMHEISVNYNDQLKMGQGIVSLVSSMLEEFCPCLKELDYDFKNEVVQKFFPKFNMLNGGFNTTIKFPDPSDFRIVGHFNTTFDLANLDNFFPVEIFSDEALKAAKDLVIKCRIYSNKLLKLSVTETEISALLVLAFWSEKRLECKEFREKGVESSKINAQISKELYLYALEKYGLENVGIRIGNLMCIFHDVDTLIRELEQALVIYRLFASTNITNLMD